jgi:4-hydroxybenzoate polyprenyltransferase
VSNLPTVWTNVLAAAVLAGVTASGAAVAAVALAGSLFYVGGMFLNDAFDREIDARERPERPIPAGRASPREVFGWGFALLAAGLVVVALTGRALRGDATPALVAGTALAGAIVLYDAWHKSNPIAPLLMGLCRVLVYLTTAATLAGALPAPVVGVAGLVWLYLIALTVVARHERLGSVRALWPFVSLAAPLCIWSLALHAGPAGVVLWVGTVAWVLACVSHLGWRARLDVPRAVVGLIAGIALVDALAIATFGSPELAALAVACFGLTVVLQRWVPGT